MTETLIKPFIKRIDNPVLITFIIVFILYNWKFFYLLFIPFKLPEQSSLVYTRVEYALNNLSTTTISIGTTKAGYLEVPEFFFLPIVLSLLSLLIMPVIVLIYDWYTLKVYAKESTNKEQAKITLARKIFEKQQEEQDYQTRISQIENNIKDLKKGIINIRKNTTNEPDAKFKYNLLKDSEKDVVAKAIYSLKNALEYKKRENQKTGYIEILKVNENGTVILTDEAKVILESYSKEKPGKL